MKLIVNGKDIIDFVRREITEMESSQELEKELAAIIDDVAKQEGRLLPQCVTEAEIVFNTLIALLMQLRVIECMPGANMTTRALAYVSVELAWGSMLSWLIDHGFAHLGEENEEPYPAHSATLH